MRLSDVYYYVQGNVRFFIATRISTGLIREHIWEQITARVMSSDRRCMENGKCRMCGCRMPHLLYADKSCDRPCYPRMMGKREWYRFRLNRGNDEWHFHNGRFTKLEQAYE